MYWLTGFLGLIAFVSPFVFGYTSNPGALWMSLGVGAILMVTAFLEGMAEDKQTWEYWVAGVTGLGALASPFVLGFYGQFAAVWTMVIVGLVTMIAAGARLTQGGTGGRYHY